MHDTATTAPGVPIIGYLKSGRPVYMVAGADGPPADPAPASAPTDPAPEPAPPPAPTPPAPEPAPTEDLASLPEWAQRAIKDARADAGKARTNAKQAAAEEARKQLAQDIGKALGLVPDDGQVDPAKLTEQLQQSQTDAASARIELSVFRIAQDAGANANKLLDSITFRDEIDSLDVDPSDAKAFREAVEAKIAEAVKRDPSLKAAGQAPARSGAAHPGGPGGEQQLTDDDLKRMTPEQIVEAQDRGLLKNLLGG